MLFGTKRAFGNGAGKGVQDGFSGHFDVCVLFNFEMTFIFVGGGGWD